MVPSLIDARWKTKVVALTHASAAPSGCVVASGAYTARAVVDELTLWAIRPGGGRVALHQLWRRRMVGRVGPLPFEMDIVFPVNLGELEKHRVLHRVPANGGGDGGGSGDRGGHGDGGGRRSS